MGTERKRFQMENMGAKTAAGSTRLYYEKNATTHI